jgi:hypothetical protein
MLWFNRGKESILLEGESIAQVMPFLDFTDRGRVDLAGSKLVMDCGGVEHSSVRSRNMENARSRARSKRGMAMVLSLVTPLQTTVS